eukprot:gene8976-11397_t
MRAGSADAALRLFGWRQGKAPGGAGRAGEGNWRGEWVVLSVALLLIGGKALRRRWWVLALAGASLVALAGMVMADLTDGATLMATRMFGLVFLFAGAAAVLGILTTAGWAGRAISAVKAIVLLVLGGMILDTPIRND